ncbi:MAG: alpha-L-arabinofuranosidase, partial [Lachnospiraceae bacterium]|nr:alpha-L-arabinofuranosidase [Lachnospiraceae bacterium]
MAKLNIETKKPRFPVAPDLYGLFFEDINRAGDGGLYPEMLRNRSFEDSIPPEDCTIEENDFAFTNRHGWRDIFNHGEGLTRWIRDNKTPFTPIPAWYVQSGASIALNYKDTLNKKRLVSLDVSFGAGFVYNDGYAGVAIDAGKAYTFYMFAKNVKGSGEVSVSLEDAEGKVYDKKSFRLCADGFVRYDAVFVTAEKKKDCRLVLRGDGAIRLGFISLMPADTYNGHGLRTDIVEMYKGINPRFLRFPGGCVVEGFTFQTMQYFRN